MRGAEILSAAAGTASCCSEKRGTVRFAHAHGKQKFKPLLAPLVTMRSAALPALALQRPQGLQAAPTRRAHLSQRATQDRRRGAPWRGKARRLAKRWTLRREQGDRTSTRQGGAELSAGRRPSAPR